MRTVEEIIAHMREAAKIYGCKQSDAKDKMWAKAYAEIADELENSVEYTTFHRHDHKNEIRESPEFKEAVRNLMAHQRKAAARRENEMSYNYRALSDDSDKWLGKSVYSELVDWAEEQGMSLWFYDRANIRGDYQYCFTLKW